MKIGYGVNRIVLLLPNLKLAIKFPFAYYNIRNAFYDLREKRGKKEDIPWLSIRLRFVKNLFRFFFRACRINWREFTYYLKRRHPIIQPTYFSLLGLVNIQRYGVPIPCDTGRPGYNKQFTFQIDAIFKGILLNKGILLRQYSDPHHFRNPDNFSIKNGQLCMHDYGEAHVQKALDLFGEILFQNYDPNRVITFEEWCDKY
ncbi:MAG: hypothetical protein UT91_C0035G0004 [Parcubacteria group bacterium GW2011_GWA2_40_23]|nr:MAG: hypothetical protein UT91_C0035G0004 [Parcubacteria group bacterium GW2011_GWA2_40_23]